MRLRQGKLERSASAASTMSDEEDAEETRSGRGGREEPKDKKMKTRQTFFIRMWMTFFMIGLFFVIMSLGHSVVVAEIYLLQVRTAGGAPRAFSPALPALPGARAHPAPRNRRVQVLTFRELLNVRYNHAKEHEIPWFRSVHWSIFAVASFYSNGVPVLEYLDRYGVPMAETAAHYHTLISFTGYVTVFMAIVLSLRKGYYRYQMGARSPL